MRTILFILILAMANGLVSHASAEDLFVGRVLSVDRETGKLSVESMDDGKEIEVTIPADRLPKSLLPGNVVRIWGGTNAETGVLNATNVQVSGQTGYGQDRTGVRRRIGKSHGQYGGQGGSKGRGR